MTTDGEKTGRVLVIDDETAICRIVTRTLERNGFEAMSVSTAGDVAEVLKTKSFDVILLDRSMGPADGSTLLPIVKAGAPAAKILFFTGEYVEQQELDLVDGVVQKPINGRDLAATLRKLL